MLDKVTMWVEGFGTVNNLASYSLETDMYLAASSFTVGINPRQSAENDFFIKEGSRIKIFVNGIVDLDGIIDSVKEGGSKDEFSITLAGRDLMGILCDHHCEEFGFKALPSNTTIKELVESMIKDVPFIEKSNIIYQWAAQKVKDVFEQSCVEVGSTVFDVLKQYTSRRGMLFFALPNSKFILGNPNFSGPSDFSLIRRKRDSIQNNIIEGSVTRDISNAFSKVVVLGQKENTFDNSLDLSDEMKAATTPEEIQRLNDRYTAAFNMNTNIKVTAEMPKGIIPFYKPYVTKSNTDSKSAKVQAQSIIEACRASMFVLEYTVPFHSQNGLNFSVKSEFLEHLNFAD